MFKNVAEILFKFEPLPSAVAYNGVSLAISPMARTARITRLTYCNISDPLETITMFDSNYGLVDITSKFEISNKIHITNKIYFADLRLFGSAKGLPASEHADRRIDNYLAFSGADIVLSFVPTCSLKDVPVAYKTLGDAAQLVLLTPDDILKYEVYAAKKLILGKYFSIGGACDLIVATQRVLDIPECPICLTYINFNMAGSVRTKCGHIFHYVAGGACLSRWMADNPYCPYCKAPLFLSEFTFSTNASRYSNGDAR